MTRNRPVPHEAQVRSPCRAPCSRQAELSHSWARTPHRIIEPCRARATPAHATRRRPPRNRRRRRRRSKAAPLCILHSTAFPTPMPERSSSSRIVRMQRREQLLASSARGCIRPWCSSQGGDHEFQSSYGVEVRRVSVEATCEVVVHRVQERAVRPSVEQRCGARGRTEVRFERDTRSRARSPQRTIQAFGRNTDQRTTPRHAGRGAPTSSVLLTLPSSVSFHERAPCGSPSSLAWRGFFECRTVCRAGR